jgi:hypothetical protein
MSRSPVSPPPSLAEWPPEQTHAALKKQLASVEQLRGKDRHEAEHEERAWSNLTENILSRGFGVISNNVHQFKHARLVGATWAPSMSEETLQQHFQRRMDAFAAVVRSSMEELELMMPQPEIAGSYEPGDVYEFYVDLKTVVGFAAKELLIVDNFLDTQIFDVYMQNLNPLVTVRVLTQRVADPLRLVAEKFSRRGNFELRSGGDVHDRVVFSDDRCWVIGHSIKDAAKNKPTYIVEHSGATAMKGIYEPIWAAATIVVKG